MLTNRVRQVKQLVLRFPNGIECTNSHYNKRKNRDDRKLKNNLRMLDVEVGKDSEGDPEIHNMSYLYWKVVIKGEEQMLVAEAQSESDDEWEDARQRMSNMRL
jgi:hypothetical protein